MSKLKMNTREIGSVCVFDLVGDATEESLSEVALKIQKSIRRHRLQRVILNLQMMPSIEPVGLRKLMAACIRPQRSLIYGVSEELAHSLEQTYLPRNVRICPTEKEIAEDLGPFLLERDRAGLGFGEGDDPNAPGSVLERRRSKRMHVALPIELKITLPDRILLTKAIATNISEGGLFAEYLDLETSLLMENLEPAVGLVVEVVIFPSANFPEEYHLQGRLNRKEFRKKQLGVAVEFVV